MKRNIVYISLFLLILLNLGLIIYNFSIKSSSYIVLDENNIWEINDNNISKTSKSKLKRLNYSDAKLYSKDIIEGYFSGSNNFKFYDKTNEEILQLDISLIVIGEKEIQNYTYLLTENITTTDENNIRTFLKSYSIDYDKENTQTLVAKLKNNMNLYSITTLAKDGPSENPYSIVFINDELIYLKTSISDDKRISKISKIIDIDNDGDIDLILKSGISFSAGNECYSLYKYDNTSNSYIEIINCEGDD